MLCSNGAPLIARRAKCQRRVANDDKALLHSLRRWDAFKGRCVKLRQELDRGREDGEGTCSFVDELKAMADVVLLRSQERVLLPWSPCQHRNILDEFLHSARPARQGGVCDGAIGDHHRHTVLTVPNFHKHDPGHRRKLLPELTPLSNGNDPQESILVIRVSGWLLNLGQSFDEPSWSLLIGPGSRRAVLIQALQESTHVRLHRLLFRRCRVSEEGSR